MVSPRYILIRVLVLVNVTILLFLITSKTDVRTRRSVDLDEPPEGAVKDLFMETQADEGTTEALTTESNPPFPCEDFIPRSYSAQRGDYTVLYNYFKGTKSFRCGESITYTTHSDWTFLDNLLPLLERWQGPISLSIYAPGSDFDKSLEVIQFLRECSDSLVKDYVTFHIYFDQAHTPETEIPPNPEQLPVDCSALTNTVIFGEQRTYKRLNKLFYPVNVGRNVAKEMSTTHFVFPSDIELYPSPNLIPDFLDMIRRNDPVLQSPAPKVFVVSVFEVDEQVHSLPNNKEELIQLLIHRKAVPFHKYVCASCHRVPKALKWARAPMLPGLRVVHVAKRHKPYTRWEPIYIGTKSDPTYDERLSWDGERDKMVQGYALCLLDYEFHILDNAFLVHRPGIKRKKRSQNRKKKLEKKALIAKQFSLISETLLPELRRMYGTKEEC